MITELSDLLKEGEGRSEFVIVVVADIRGFSAFSKQKESPDIAMFIKRFYLSLLNEFFPFAKFAKPTGDGMLLTFQYSEKSLLDVTKMVVEACHKCLTNFKVIFKDDPMINFPFPHNIGFGISRGTACCLFSGENTLDYSGHMLNLASRLMDLARPSGIVIDGNFGKALIPESLRGLFVESNVYIKSLAEEFPHPILSLKDYVVVPVENLSPLKGENWFNIETDFLVSDLKKKGPRFLVELPEKVKSKDKIIIKLIHPAMKNKKMVPGCSTIHNFEKYSYSCPANEPQISLELSEAYKYLKADGVPESSPVRFKIQFVPIKPVMKTV